MFAWTDHAAEQVSKSFSQRVLQHRLVQAQVRNKLLQPPHFVLEMLQTTHLLHRDATLDLAQRKRDLLFRESLPFHR